MNNQTLKNLTECFYNNLDQLENDFQNGKVSLQEYNTFRENLNHGYGTDLEELRRNS